MLLVNKVCLCLFLLIWSSSCTTSNSLVLAPFVSLLLSLYEGWNLSYHIGIRSRSWYESWHSSLSLAPTLCNESSITPTRCVHHWHTCMFAHRWLRPHLQFTGQWHARWSTFSNASEVCPYSLITLQILVWDITELSLMLCIRETVVVKFTLQWWFPLTKTSWLLSRTWLQLDTIRRGYCWCSCWYILLLPLHILISIW